MKNNAGLLARLLLCVGAILASSTVNAVTVYTWTGFYKDTGMAQFPAMAGATVNGQYMLYLGSENFSTGPGKVNTFNAQGAVDVTFTTPLNDSSIDMFAAFIALGGGSVKGFYIGTDTAHVYFFDGTTFTNVTPTAAAFSSNRGVYGGAQYGNRVFIGTGGSAGSAQVWAYDGTNWTQQSLPGFPSSNYYAWCMTVYNNVLYLGTVDYSQAAQVWKYDGNSWSMMSIPGFSASNYAVASMAVYNGKLYIGTSNTLGSGAEIWSYNGSSWAKLAGFGKNDAATSMTVYNNALYIGTTNYAQNGVGQLWTYDGTTLAQVTAPAAFGAAGNSGIVSLAAANGELYAGTYNNSGAELWSVSASGTTGPGANSPGALTGLFWNPNESGWGIHFTQRGSNIFAAWYTYDASGNPKWYVASNCAGASAASGTCAGPLYQVSGPAFFGVNFNASLVNVAAAGNLSVTFQDTNNGSMTYTVGGQTRTVAISRQNVGTGSTVAPVDYTDLWWNPSESGWGIAMAQQFGNVFLAWYVYQSNGQPVWYVASNCTLSGNSCSGTLYSTTGPAFGPTFDPTQVHVSTVGNVTVTFTDANNAVLSYTVNGVVGSKNITRQLF